MYHIEIKNLENDEVIVDKDAVTILGSITEDKDNFTVLYNSYNDRLFVIYG